MYKSKVKEKERENAFPFPVGGVVERSETEPTTGNGGAKGGLCHSGQGDIPPDPEVDPRPTRRRHSAEYKLRILREADACGYGGIGALLRREGLYSHQLYAWRKQMEARLSPKKPGRKASNNQFAAENAKLERTVKRLELRLKRAEIIIEAQKKLCDALGLEVPMTEVE